MIEFKDLAKKELKKTVSASKFSRFLAIALVLWYFTIPSDKPIYSKVVLIIAAIQALAWFLNENAIQKIMSIYKLDRDGNEVTDE
jgi:hypothetical protein